MIIKLPKRATCIGVHCNFWSVKDSKPAIFGARDYWSYYTLKSCYREIFSWVSGCWSSSFPKYAGARQERIWARAGEAPEGFEKVSHGTWDEWGWKGTLHQAIKLLIKYQTAEKVITDRLHCAIPCMAFGTDVEFVTPAGGWERFSALDIDFNQSKIDVKTKPRDFNEISNLVDDLPTPVWP